MITVTISAVDLITISSNEIIHTAAVTSPNKSSELTTFLKSVVQGDGRLVSLGRAARSSTMNISYNELCDIGLHGSGSGYLTMNR